MTLARPAFPVVLAAPSGAGKTTLARMLVDRNDDVAFSISATTRAPRRGELDGRDYHFVDDPTFDSMIERDELAEWAVVHGHRYGTPRREIASALQRNRTVVLDIDVQGARQVRRVFPRALLIFILPPSAAELARRLTGRASEKPAERRRRLSNALREITAAPEFDFVVLNEDVERAYGRVEAIVRSEWSRVERIPELERFTGSLARDLEAIIRDEG